MTDGNVYYQEFLSSLQKKISPRAKLVNTITDILAIDKDSIYRRLRGEVNFSFSEMSVVAKNLGISLDKIAGIENLQTKPSTMNLSRQINPTEHDYEMFEGHVNLLKSIKDEPDTEIIQSGSFFPHYLYMKYEYLTKFYMFVWNQASGFGDACPYHQILIPERLRALQKDTFEYARHISSTVYVFDHNIFQAFVTNVKYFNKVDLIKEEDVAKIKTELTEFLNYLELLAARGKHEETDKKISFYITDIDCDMNYHCLKSKNIRFTLFWAFILNAIVCYDDEVFNETVAWINSLQRMSTLISVSGEKIRAAFFNSQREIIQTL